MPTDLFLIRLIHSVSRRPYPGECIWNACQLLHGETVRLLRRRNQEGFDVYILPFAGQQNAGYILLDLDHADAQVIPAMQAQRHPPCVVLRSSPGHLQAWVHVSSSPLAPAVASAIGKHLALLYGGDPASTDWRHLGRLAGFANQKLTYRQGGACPWVKLLHAQAELAPEGASLVAAAQRALTPAALPPDCTWLGPSRPVARITPAAASHIYIRCLERLRIPQRFPQPDWSIADLWIAQHLLACHVPTAQIQAVLRLGSPGFPRRHADPEDYLRRTLAQAFRRWHPAAASPP